MKKLSVLLLLSLFIFDANATPGRRDATEGHDSGVIGYHCHSRECFEYYHKIDKSIRTPAGKKLKYNRSEFGPLLDKDGDCQNIRAELLIKTSLETVTFRTDKECRVDTGLWICPYTGKTFRKASDVELEHYVPLKFVVSNYVFELTFQSKI